MPAPLRAVHGDDAGATEAEVVLQRHLRTLDLALAGLDAADALAVALCHLQAEKARRRFGLPDGAALARPRGLGTAAGASVKTMPADFRVSITNAPGKGVYPISSFTWLLFYENPKDKGRGRIMVDFLKWALTDGQKYAKDLGYAPLPESVVALEMEALKRIKT